MDIDHAKKRLYAAEDRPPFSDILVGLLDLVALLDDTIARQRLRIDDLEADLKDFRQGTAEVFQQLADIEAHR